jgi:hypothetical protein
MWISGVSMDGLIVVAQPPLMILNAYKMRK